MNASAAPRIGDVLPIWLVATNGEHAAYQVFPEQIFAIDEKHNCYLPIPPEIVASSYRPANKWVRDAFAATAVAAAIGGAIGTGLAAGAPSFFAGAMGGGIGAAFSGTWIVENSTDATMTERIRALALHQTNLRQGFSEAGYVYFEGGSYHGLEAVLIDSSTLSTTIVEVPLR